MKKETELDLITTKFLSASKQAQIKLLGFALDNGSPNKDLIVDMLNNKKLTLESKNITEGDYIYFNLNEYTGWRSIDRNYYINNNLLINNTFIKTKVLSINPFSNYVNLDLFIIDGRFETIDVFYSNLTDQSTIQAILAE